MFETLDATPSWLADLNHAQRAAVAHGDGPLLIVAGAGTGKTKTLVARLAALIDRGVPPQRILLVTFTRRAARDMLGRAGRMTQPQAASQVWGGTFHSIANRLLRMHGRSVGLMPQFTVMDQGDAADMMNLARADLDLGAGRRRFPRKDTLASIYSSMVNLGAKLDDVLEGSYPWCLNDVEGIRQVFATYTERKRRHAVLDYDDLLLFWRALAGATRLGDLFDHILVDEYQDTNALQADILRGMRAGNSNITVVGDDAQAIYSFRGATVENILAFPQHFEAAEVVTLEQNYRSVQPILDATNAVIAESRRRYAKDLWSARAGAKPSLVTCLDEAEQSDIVCRKVLEARETGTRLDHQAVLFRAAHHSALLEVELTQRNIPYVKYGGLRFLEAAHVKDTLAFLRVLENPFDELAWFRLLGLLEGIGPKSAGRIIGEIGARDGAGPSPLDRLIDNPPKVPEAAREEVCGLAAALSDCSRADLTPAAQVERIRRFFEPLFARVYTGMAARLHDLEALEKIAAGYTSRGRFISELTLDPPASTADLAGPPALDEDHLILSTIHSAKGGEWDVVHVIHAADGMIPSDMATSDEATVEEERRVFYVALTRARHSLNVYVPLRYYHRTPGMGDPHTYAQPTRFISKETRALFAEECHHEIGVDGAAPDSEGPNTAAAEIDGWLASLWS